MARTALLAALRRALRAARAADDSRDRPRTSAAVERPISRRRFVGSVAAAGGAIAAGSVLGGCAAPARRGSSPRIAIVGAGLAGLRAADELRRHGLHATVYEGSSRAGGRVFTARDLLAQGLTTELGGEFIDSSHQDVLALAAEFDLPLIDVRAASERTLVREAVHFDGRLYSEQELVEAFYPVAARLAADRARLGDDPLDTTSGAAAIAFDHTTLTEYLATLPAVPWLRALLEVAYVTEFGLETDEQSALNLLTLIDDDASDGSVDLFGESDERYKILGGNDRVTEALATRVAEQTELDHRLVAIRDVGRHYRLTFDRRAAGTREVDADFVVLALPFTLLRDVSLPASLPGWKRRVIDELGYGANAKLLVGFERRVWRDAGFAGNAFSDRPFQLAWDSSRLQPVDAGGLTLYSGGRAAFDVGNDTPEIQADRLLPGVAEIFPGLQPARNGRVHRFHWPTHPWSKAAYSCYRPGQWTRLRGTEARPAGRLWFAGEHCSRDFQGYMNGAAETGRMAAQSIVRRCREPVRAERRSGST